MTQFDIENGMVMNWLDRYEEQEISEYGICRAYYLLIDTQDTKTAENIAENIMDGIRGVFSWVIGTEDRDGMKLVTIGAEAHEYGYDVSEASDTVKQMIDEVLKHSELVEDYDSDYLEAA